MEGGFWGIAEKVVKVCFADVGGNKDVMLL